jgi:hypothetical protein
MLEGNPGNYKHGIPAIPNLCLTERLHERPRVGPNDVGVTIILSDNEHLFNKNVTERRK